MRFSPKAKWIILLTVGSIAVPTVVWGKWYLDLMGSQPPWFDRGRDLRPIPYRIVIGPLDADHGIRGLLEPGMTKTEVKKKLSAPLVPGLPVGTPPSDSIWDPEDAAADFFGGVFAWVQYGDKDRVISISFDLLAFTEKFKGDQQVLLAYRGKTYLLHKSLTLREALSMFRGKGLGTMIRVQSDELILQGTGTSLSFTGMDGGLQTITVIIR